MNRLEYARSTESIIVQESRLNLRLIAIALTGVFAFLDLYATQPLLPLISHVFDASDGAVGLTVSATTLGVALSAPFAGMVSDRFGRKPVIVYSLIGVAIPTLMASSAETLKALIVWRFVAGVFMPGIISAALAYISEEWPVTETPTVVATYVTGSVVGGFIGRLLSGGIAERFGWHYTFIALGALSLVGAAAIGRWLPSSTRFSPQLSFRQGVTDFLVHLKNPLLIATCVVGFSVLFSLVATFTFITFHLAARPYCLGATAQGMLFAVYLLGIFVTPESGKWIAKYGRRASVVAASLIASVGVLMTLASPLWLVIVGLALCSAGVFVCQAAASSFIGVAATRSRSLASGLYVTFYYIGGSAGAAFPAVIWDRFGWPGCVTLIVTVQVIAAIVAFVFWRTPKLSNEIAEPIAEILQ